MTDQEILDLASQALKQPVTNVADALRVLRYLSREVEEAKRMLNLGPDESLAKVIEDLKKKRDSLIEERDRLLKASKR